MKKTIKVIIVTIAIIVLLALIFFVVDYNRVQKQERPIFCIQNPAGIINDGGTIEYFGLGYKVIDFHTLAGFDDIKIGTWLMDYNDFEQEMKEYEMKEYEMKIDTNNKKHYSKTIDETLIELDIPNTWNYEEMPKDEENDFYKYALKIYKDNDEQYAMLYVYNTMFGVCGTGRTSKNVILNNGKEATIGYYDGNNNWSDISFYKIDEYIAVINYGLVDSNAEEIIKIIKTINITNEQNDTKSNRTPDNVIIEVESTTIKPESVTITITDNNENQYGWGVEFRVQEKVNGEWKNLNYVSDDLPWIDIAYELGEDKQLTQKLDIEKYYGKLSNGIYRIVKPVYDNGYVDIYSNEFEIK